jgi:tRNA U34 5-methylaminomethyl-2-thiouridine-forming methyltransferase MnmC
MEIILTKDGSHSIYSKHFKDAYHSRSGAIQEARYIYINLGLREALSYVGDQINILEFGFGTGLNAFLTYLFNKNQYIQTNYYAIEKYPLTWEMVSKLNYLSYLKKEKDKETFQKMHCFAGEQPIDKKARFNLKLFNGDINSFQSKQKFDLVYWDAFCPAVQSELWTEEIFKKIYKMMQKPGLLVTYSSKGEVKEALKKAGFEVKRRKGPGHKWHVLQARAL